MVQRLRLCASSAGGTGSIPAGELKSQMLRGMVKKKKRTLNISWSCEWEGSRDKYVIYLNPGGSEVKASALNAGDLGFIPGSGGSPGESLESLGSIPGREDPLEKEMVTHSSILAWRIPWTEKPGRLQSTGSQRVGHDWATSPKINSPRRTAVPTNPSNWVSHNIISQIHASETELMGLPWWSSS